MSETPQSLAGAELGVGRCDRSFSMEFILSQEPGSRELRRAALFAELLQGERLGCSSELDQSLARGSGSSWNREMKCVKQGSGSSPAPVGSGEGLVIFLGSEIPVWEEEISKGRFSFPRAGAGPGFSDS